MTTAEESPITEKDIVGLKYFDQLGELLQQLHDVGCEPDRAGNRTLHMDQYCMLILLYMFNPVVTSLRGLQQASELQKVQKKLGCGRSTMGSLSESVAVFDAERLKPIIESLGEKLAPIAADTRLKDLAHTLTLVDGSIVEALPRIAMASFREAQSGSGKKMKWTLSSTSICRRSSTNLAQLHLSAKIFSGREDVHVSRQASMFLLKAYLSSDRHCTPTLNAAPVISQIIVSMDLHHLAMTYDMHSRRSETDRPTSRQACQHDCRFFLRKTPEPEMFRDNKLRNPVYWQIAETTTVGQSQSTGQ